MIQASNTCFESFLFCINVIVEDSTVALASDCQNSAFMAIQGFHHQI